MFSSYHSTSGSGYDVNTGARSLLVYLGVGDELNLGTTVMENSAHRIIFCVSLEQAYV